MNRSTRRNVDVSILIVRVVVRDTQNQSERVPLPGRRSLATAVLVPIIAAMISLDPLRTVALTIARRVLERHALIGAWLLVMLAIWLIGGRQLG